MSERSWDCAYNIPNKSNCSKQVLFTCMFTYTYTYTYVHAYNHWARIFVTTIHAYVSVYVWPYTNTCFAGVGPPYIRTCIHSDIRTHMHACIRTHMHACMHAYRRSYFRHTHTSMHIFCKRTHKDLYRWKEGAEVSLRDILKRPALPAEWVLRA